MRTVTRLQTILMSLGILVILSGGAFADDLMVVQPGTRIRISVLDPSTPVDTLQVVTGRYLGQVEAWKHLGSSAEAIALDTSGSESPLTILTENITGWEVGYMKSRRGQGALKGFAIGAGAGLLLGFADGDDPEGMFSMTAEGKAAFAGVTLGAIGALIGLATAGEGEVWQPVSSDRIQLGLNHDRRKGTGFRVCVGF